MRKSNLLSGIIICAAVIVLAAFSIRAEAAKGAKTLDSTFAVSARAALVDSATVSFTANLPSIPASDDGILYLYRLKTYEYTPTAGSELLGTSPASVAPAFSFALNHNTANTRLYDKFVLCVKSGGAVTMISYPQYIVNPEVLATHTHARKNHGKKGLIGTDSSNLFLDAPNQLAPSQCPRVVSVMNTGANQTITNPYSRPASFAAETHPVTQSYYMLNASDAAGVTQLAQKMEKYGAQASNCDDWIIGNEVNVRQWNYMIWVSWDEYLRQYEQAFRVCYTALKSQNANCNVYICLDQNWDRNRAASHAEYYQYIDGKDFLDRFNADIAATGNIDWGVAQHPYTVPLTYAKFWDMSGCPDGAYCANMINSNKMVSYQNLGVITSYISQPQFISPKGAVRHFILSEIGVTNAQGDQVQAAGICTAYMAAATNPYVEQILFSSANHGSFDSTFTPLAQDMYNNMDGANAAAYQATALAIMGKSSFAEVIR